MQAHAGKDLLSTMAGSIMLLTALAPAPAMAAMPTFEVRNLPVQMTAAMRDKKQSPCRLYSAPACLLLAYSITWVVKHAILMRFLSTSTHQAVWLPCRSLPARAPRLCC